MKYLKNKILEYKDWHSRILDEDVVLKAVVFNMIEDLTKILKEFETITYNCTICGTKINSKSIDDHEVDEPSLPTKECIEDWWAEGKEGDKFWQDAPFRTNGDVVEEIKIAVKYFITKWQ